MKQVSKWVVWDEATNSHCQRQLYCNIKGLVRCWQRQACFVMACPQAAAAVIVVIVSWGTRGCRQKKKRVREGVGRRGCGHGGRNERTTRNSDILWASITWWAESKWTWHFIWTSDLRSVDRDAPHSLTLLAPATQRPRNILGEYFFSYLSSYLN